MTTPGTPDDYVRALDLLRADGVDVDALLTRAAKNIESWRNATPEQRRAIDAQIHRDDP